MKAIVIDDEPWILRYFMVEAKEIPELEVIGSYTDPLKALSEATDISPEIAFVDIEMPRLSGPETVKRLKDIHPEIKVIFISAYEQAQISLKYDISNYIYLRKPYDKDDLKNAIESALKQ